MKMNNFFRRSLLSVCVLCLAAVVLLTGCEPLRKKFTRQKKKDQLGEEKFIPVLVPEEYPVKQYNIHDSYSQHYSLFKIWFSDFDSTYDQSINEKRQIYNLQAALKELGEMRKLLKGPAQDGLINIEKQVQYILNEYSKPKSFRNDARIHSEIRSIQFAVDKQYKIEKIEGSFVGE